MKEKYNIEKKTWICLIIALISACLLTGWLGVRRGIIVSAKEEIVQSHLAQETLRFHVLANSDSEADQAVKLEVKEAVLNYLKEEMPQQKEASVAETKEWIENHLTELEGVAKKTLVQAGSEDTVTAQVTTARFPTKTYGDVTFPAGEYQALRIKIGQAKGHNWWCCLYPNLCFVDAVHAVVPEEGKEALRQVLAEEEYDMVTTAGKGIRIKWFFFGE